MKSKKSILILSILIAVLVAALLLFTPTASAEESIEFDYLIDNYYQFGTMSELFVENDNIYAYERRDDGLYLRVLGENQALVRLKTAEEYTDESYESYKLTAVDGKAYMYLGGERLFVYDVTTGKLTDDSAFPTSKKIDEFISYDLTAICADTLNKVLIIDYTNMIIGYDLKQLGTGSKIENSYVLYVSINNSYENMLVKDSFEGGVELLFYSDDGYVYTLKRSDYQDGKPNNVSTTERTQSLYFATHPSLYAQFSDGAEYTETGVSIQTAGGEYEIPLGELADDKLGSVDGLFACGDKLYVVDNTQAAIKVFEIVDDEPKLVKMLGSKGYGSGENASGLTRFDQPTMISATADGVAVYDDGNQRIVLMVDGVTKPVKVVDSPISALCLSENLGKYIVWYAIDNQVYGYDPDGGEGKVYTAPSTVTSIGWDGYMLSAVSQNKLYRLKSGAFAVVDDVTSAQVCWGMHDSVYYLNKDGNISMRKNATSIIELVTDREFDRWASDYKGNLWLIKGDVVTCYRRMADTFESFDLKLPIEITEWSFTSKGKVYALKGDAVVELKLPVSGSDDVTSFEGTKYTENYQMLKVVAKDWAYQTPDNYESVLDIPEGTTSVVFEQIEYLGGVYYLSETLINDDYVRIYFRGDSVELLPNVPSELNVVHKGPDREPKGYEYPSKSAKPVVDIPSEPLEVISVVGEGKNVWFQVKVVTDDGDVICYVEQSNNYVTTIKPYPEVKRYYALISLPQLGSSACVYAEPSLDAEVLQRLTEGYKIESDSEIDYDQQFTRIRWGEGFAYVETKYLTTSKLTNGQKFGLIFGAVAFGLIILSTALVLIIKKRSKN